MSMQIPFKSCVVVLALGMFTGCDVEYGIGGENDEVNAPKDTEGSGTTGTENIPEDMDTGAVQGRVCGLDGEEYVAGASVSILTEWGKLETVTDENGYFKLEGVPTGTYNLHIEKDAYSANVAVAITANEVLQLAEDECIGDVNIAVVTGDFDRVEQILDNLGINYDTIQGGFGTDMYEMNTEHVEFMSDPARLAQYDVIFFNCGLTMEWSYEASNIPQNIRNYVENGGSAYASDQAYFILEAAFPNAATFIGDDSVPGEAYVGAEGIVDGGVQSSQLKAALGKDRASINYDLGSWAAIESTTEAEILIDGTYQIFHWDDMYGSGTDVTGPLAIRHQAGAGQFLYTTFHNEQQTTDDMVELLKAFVLSL